ncbi:hypothetical protein Pan216_37130 [Planctomycetes bacterium Pan216]|uniref:Uncharacterized protein n=1 Tax=Kolteria novifilia TaxID=2527975 RepID=A0A518B798_9BACT|nr:hypothetical protein Pan216_37130 [Planctomycetes bacterium Pan216]
MKPQCANLISAIEAALLDQSMTRQVLEGVDDAPVIADSHRLEIIDLLADATDDGLRMLTLAKQLAEIEVRLLERYERFFAMSRQFGEAYRDP